MCVPFLKKMFAKPNQHGQMNVFQTYLPEFEMNPFSDCDLEHAWLEDISSSCVDIVRDQEREFLEEKGNYVMQYEFFKIFNDLKHYTIVMHCFKKIVEILNEYEKTHGHDEWMSLRRNAMIDIQEEWETDGITPYLKVRKLQSEIKNFLSTAQQNAG